jgi:hypothetical protein
MLILDNLGGLIRIVTRRRQDTTKFCLNLLHNFLEGSFLGCKFSQSAFCNWMDRNKSARGDDDNSKNREAYLLLKICTLQQYLQTVLQ